MGRPSRTPKRHYAAAGDDAAACNRPLTSPDVRATTSVPSETTCGQCRIALGLDTLPAVLEAVEATLRYVTNWAYDVTEGPHPYAVSVQDLTSAAEQVAAYTGAPEQMTACPVCEEVRCDEDCPLEPVRGALGLWSGA